MRARNESPHFTYGRDAFAEIFDELGLRTEAQKAGFLDVAESTFNRVHRREMRPGEDFIARTLVAVANEPKLKDHASAKFERLFPIRLAVAS